jgi:transposase
MHKTREILRLRWCAKRSTRETAASVGVSTGVVGKATARAEKAGLAWAVVEQLSDSELERLLYGERSTDPRRMFPEQQPERIHRELLRPGVTLELLHLEYLEAQPDGMQYTAFCDRYRAWKRNRRLTMRQSHKAGERMFVDFSGKRPSIVDRVTGEVREVELFVAVLGASSMTFCCAVESQRVTDWLHVHEEALAYFGGTAEIWTPDCLKSAVTRVDRYEPELQRSYAAMAAHHAAVVIPARPYKARDKAKVEVAVQVAQRWILARLRHETFFDLPSLNARIRELCEVLNDRPRRALGGTSRRELFEAVERKALKPLASDPYVHREVLKKRAGTDYHVEVDRHWYSVPHALANAEVEMILTPTMVEILRDNRRVALHVRSAAKHMHTTDRAHRPPSHDAWNERDAGGLESWAKAVGPATSEMMTRILTGKIHREQAWRSGRGLRRLAERHGEARLERICAQANALGARTYKSVERMLRLERDRLELADETTPNAIEHEHIRGGAYYAN